jgi:hypothetical protein
LHPLLFYVPCDNGMSSHKSWTHLILEPLAVEYVGTLFAYLHNLDVYIAAVKFWICIDRAFVLTWTVFINLECWVAVVVVVVVTRIALCLYKVPVFLYNCWMQFKENSLMF